MRAALPGLMNRLRPLLLRRPLSTAAPKSYSERMDLTGRPISPHISIYKFPTIAFSSGTVRATGFLLFIGTTGVASMSLLGGADAPGDFASSIASSSIAPLAKFSVGFSLVYHYLGAVRHIVWDKTAKGFTNLQMLQSSYALIVRPPPARRPVLRAALPAPPPIFFLTSSALPPRRCVCVRATRARAHG